MLIRCRAIIYMAIDNVLDSWRVHIVGLVLIWSMSILYINELAFQIEKFRYKKHSGC